MATKGEPTQRDAPLPENSELMSDPGDVAWQRAYLDERRRRAIPGDFGRLLAKAGSDILIPGDELPDGWLGSTA